MHLFCFFCLHTMYLFLSVLIVISGDVVRSALWDKYSKISAENPECWFTPSQYKHEWTCVFCMCVFNNPTKPPNMEKRIHLKLIVLTVLIYTVISILSLMDTFWIQKMLMYSDKLSFGHSEWFKFHACSEENPAGNLAKTSFWWFYKALHC